MSAQDDEEAVYIPIAHGGNLAIGCSGAGQRGGFSCLISDTLPDMGVLECGQWFPFFLYEETAPDSRGMKQLIRRNAISDEGLAYFQAPYADMKLRKEDVFYYIYGVLHSGQYREKYGNNLQKQLPRIPRMRCLSDFIAFRDSGLALAKLHLFYERLPLYQAVQLDCAVPLTIAPQGIDGGCDRLFEVEKMKFGGSAKGGRDKSVVVYNRHITISQIPLAAYDYLITSKSPPEWAMDRQKVSIDKASGIKNDANDYARDTLHNPRYPLELFLRLLTLSLNTQQIVRRLPDIEGRTDGQAA